MVLWDSNVRSHQSHHEIRRKDDRGKRETLIRGGHGIRREIRFPAAAGNYEVGVRHFSIAGSKSSSSFRLGSSLSGRSRRVRG
jgi:hypothetical protein